MPLVPGEKDSLEDVLDQLQPEHWALRLGPDHVLLYLLIDLLLVLVPVLCELL